MQVRQHVEDALAAGQGGLGAPGDHDIGTGFDSSFHGAIVEAGEIGGGIQAFWVDLGPLAEDTVIITMSEFGRTARENGNRGTDHGHANVMFVLGGPVRGGRVYGRWPGLDPSQLNEGRDLALTTDFRRVLGEAVDRHLGNADLNTVFPGYDNSTASFLRYLG